MTHSSGGFRSNILHNRDNVSCSGHPFMVGFSPELPLLSVHPSSPDLQHVSLTAARGTWRVTNVTSVVPSAVHWTAPDIRPVLTVPGVYRFLSPRPALIIHAAESHSHHGDRQTGQTASLCLYKILSVQLYDTISFSCCRLEETTAGLTVLSSESL